MEPNIAKLSSKSQVVIPKYAREIMGVRPGDKLVIHAVNGMTIITPKSKKLALILRGFSKGIYSKGYLAGERNSW